MIAQHAEEPRLTVGAQAHEGENASRLGLQGWPAAAEESIVARDCILAKQVDAQLHVCHVSTTGTADVLQWAKARGTKVSAEVTPHHLLLTDDRLSTYDPVNKVNPPLRTRHDVDALRQALAEGVHRLRGHRPRPARDPGQGLRVVGGPSGHARPADRAVDRRRDDGADRAAGLARRGTGDEREARRDRRPDRPGPSDRGRRAREPRAGRPGRELDGERRRAREHRGQHPVRGHGTARRGDGHHPAWPGHRLAGRIAE